MSKSISKHILIVDDSLDQQVLLATLLESKGYTTQCTSNGEIALDLLHSTLKLPDTILLDLQMPIMDGFDFRQIQRNDPLLKNIPVIVMSGDANCAAIQARTQTEVLSKPQNIDELLEVVFRSSNLH